MFPGSGKINFVTLRILNENCSTLEINDLHFYSVTKAFISKEYK